MELSHIFLVYVDTRFISAIIRCVDEVINWTHTHTAFSAARINGDGVPFIGSARAITTWLMPSVPSFFYRARGML